MSQPLRVGNFRFLSQEEIADFDVMKIPTQGDTADAQASEGRVIKWRGSKRCCS